jgi:hypothetical protein
MARKTFISYKYSEAQGLRDTIIAKLGKDAQFYQGETSSSADLTDTKTENIKKVLTDMMHGTSVTIVIISPNIKQSKWIDWEIEYCLKEITRQDRTSKTNGIVCVIQKIGGGYSWFKGSNQQADGCSSSSYFEHLVYDIIKNNRYNQNPKKYTCNSCRSIDALTGSYISYVEEDTFLSDPQKYIENAFEKSEDIDGYDLVKQK